MLTGLDIQRSLGADEISFCHHQFYNKRLGHKLDLPNLEDCLDPPDIVESEGPYCFICRCIDLWMLLISIFEPTQYASAKYDVILLATDIHDEWGWPMFGSPTGTAKSPHSHRKLNKKNMLQDILGFQLPPYVP